MIKKWKYKDFWKNLPIAKKILFEILFTALALFISNFIIFSQVNKMIDRIDSVYSSNINLNELSDILDNVQGNLKKYLEVRTYDALNSYYISESNYKNIYEKLNHTTTDNPIKLLEKNINNMSQKYLYFTNKAIVEKRSQNINKYQEYYSESTKLYRFIKSSINELNTQQFKTNSASYKTLQSALRYLETVSFFILIIIMIVSIFTMVLITRDVVNPLTNLAEVCKLVGEANFNIRATPTNNNDELGIVVNTFNTMIERLEENMERVKKTLSKEKEMQARELMMQNHLKESQLKYLQSQINPHFLYNSLNAAMQLASIEDAEKTSIFLEKMAEFFRYNVKKGVEDTTIAQEIKSVENYIYILNVRFDNEINYSCNYDLEVLDYKLPSMILQPLVENSVNHGFKNIEYSKEINLKVTQDEENIKITIKDNGIGLDQDQIQEILNFKLDDKTQNTSIGIRNVISRLKLYYNNLSSFNIENNKDSNGVTVTIILPQEGNEIDV